LNFGKLKKSIKSFRKRVKGLEKLGFVYRETYLHSMHIKKVDVTRLGDCVNFLP